MTYDINTIYTKYKQLTKKQRQQLLAALQSQGINIVKIEAYEYTDAPGIKHLFFYFAEDSRKAIPYFMLDSEVWEKIFQLVSLTHSGHYILFNTQLNPLSSLYATLYPKPRFWVCQRMNALVPLPFQIPYAPSLPTYHHRSSVCSSAIDKQ